MRLQQVQQKMLVNACLQRRTKDMAHLSVVVNLHEAPVGQAFFPAPVLQRKEQVHAAVVEVFIEGFDIPLGTVSAKSSVSCRLHIADAQVNIYVIYSLHIVCKPGLHGSVGTTAARTPYCGLGHSKTRQSGFRSFCCPVWADPP